MLVSLRTSVLNIANITSVSASTIPTIAIAIAIIVVIIATEYECIVVQMAEYALYG